MNLIRESNAHLRRENEELSKRVALGAEQLKALKDEVAPQEETGRKLKADKEALEGINTQLQQDASYWRDRWESCRHYHCAVCQRDVAQWCCLSHHSWHLIDDEAVDPTFFD